MAGQQEENKLSAKDRGLPPVPWACREGDLAKALETSLERGLGTAEVGRRRQRYGPNRLREVRRRSAWKIFAGQFASLIVGLLTLASALAFAFGRWVEGAAIGVALVINAVIGFFTELKAARSMEALHQLGGVQAKVRREGEIREVEAESLVPGDLVLLEAGDLIPADLRVVEANNLQADESALTGESVPVPKQIEPVTEEAPLAERASMLYKGTAVTAGSGAGLVVATGMATELGTIASLAEEAEEELTPLEQRLARLGRRLIWATLAVGVLVAAAGILGGKDLLLVLETAIAMAVAAVPEGLPIVATIALARGMWRMARRNALINRLSAVETLGATTVICTDKTGTLTENRMTATRLRLPSGEVEVDGREGAAFRRQGRSVDPQEEPVLKRMLEAGVLCNNASRGDGDDTRAVGDPLEVALLEAGAAAGMEREDLLEEWPEVREEAFSPETKMMATFHEADEGLRVAVKGAPEAVLAACTRVAGREESGELAEEKRRRWLEHGRKMADEGLRVLALAEKMAEAAGEDPYRGLTFLGLAGLWDPPRREVKETIRLCRKAGIRVIMVTGDHGGTARAVGRAVDLAGEEDLAVVAGEEIKDPETLSAEERLRLLRTAIFARVDPKQKLGLIALHQGQGAVVAMTGDGVNDAPALKKADIGVAMGKRGTQVAREAADMVLKDDRLSTIVTAVRYGRVIFGNIRKFIYFLLSGNVSEILIITLAAVVNAPLPLLPLQILYINLIGDIFPALALGVGEGDPTVMDRPPRDPREPVLTRSHWLGIGGYALIITAAVLGAFAFALLRLDMRPEQAVTVSFLSLSLARLWHVFNMRDRGSGLLKNEVTRNPFVWGALAIGLGLLLAAVYVPGLAHILGVTRPEARMWPLILGASLVPLLVGQVVKLRRGES